MMYVCLSSTWATGVSCAQDTRFDDRPPLAATSELTSLSLADLDGDGDADVLATDPTGGRLIWIENNSDVDPAFTIEHEVAPLVATPQAITAADLDGDGDADIAAAGSVSSGQVMWFENLGGVPPVFAPRAVGMRPNLETTGIVRSVVIADLEADGDADIICGFFLPTFAASGHVTVYLNDGAPVPSFTRFQLPSPSAALREITSLAVSDVNGDAQLDIVATSKSPNAADDADSVVVWQNTGLPVPGFLPSVIANGLGDPSSVVVERLTSDVFPEIAVALEQTNSILVLVNDQPLPGSFFAAPPLLAQGVDTLAAGDLVGSPHVDLVAATTTGLLVFENTSGVTPSFALSQIVSPDGPATALAIGKIDRDADSDLVAAGPAGARWFERVEPVNNLTTGSQHASLADAVAAIGAGDVLRAEPEHFVPNMLLPATPNDYVLESLAQLTVGPRAIVEIDAGVALRPAPGKAAKINGPIAVAPGASAEFESTEPVQIRAGQTIANASMRATASPMTLAIGPEWIAEEIDGAFAVASSPPGAQPRDVKVFHPSPSAMASVVTVSERIGGGTSGVPGSLAVYNQSTISPSGWTMTPLDDTLIGIHRSVAAGDLNRDGSDDLVSVFVPANGDPATLRLHLSNGASPPSFTTVTVGTAQASGGHAVFDLDRDGQADIVAPTGYYRQVDLQTFAFVPFPLVAGDRGIGVAIARLNADFAPDVVTHTATLSGAPSRATGFRLVALETDGQGGFVPTVIESLDRSMDATCLGDCYPDRNVALTNLNTLLAADLDHDGDDDVILSEDQGLVVYENIPGGFAPVLAADDLRWAESVATDVDGDGTLDLAVASTTTSAVLAIDNPILGTGERSELIRPFERAAAIDAGDLDGDDDTDLMVAGSGFDRIALIRRGQPQSIVLNGGGSVLQAVGPIQLDRGIVKLNGGQIAADGDLLIRPTGVVSGQGSILGTVFNGGLIETRPSMTITGDYMQFDAHDPTIAGSLDIRLPTASPDPLQVGGAAALAGDLRVDTQPGVSLGPGPRRLVTAQFFEFGLSEFTTELVPRLNVILSGQPEPGIGVVSYGQLPGQAFAELVPQPFIEPPISRIDFESLGVPADAVVGDIAGGPNGGPDGLPDLVIAYPAIDKGANGGVAVLIGELTSRGCTFRPLDVYQGKNADGPIAVEIGDFDGDGVPEIAFGNRRDSSLANFVNILDVNSQAQVPLTDSTIAPLPLPGDRLITDLAVITLSDTSLRRGPSSPATLLTLSSGGVAGIVTAATYDTAIDSWEVCDIDVCDDPDSFDPIDPDGAALLLGDGFVSSSTEDDKVLVASNTGGMPDSFPKEAFAAGSNPTEIRAADLNNDGFPDIAAINETGGTVSVFVNIADPGGPGGRSFDDGFEWTLRSDPDDPEPLPSSIALADLDDDGDLDIAVVSSDATETRAVRTLTNLFLETGSLSFSLPVNLPTQPADTPVLVREFDAEGVGGAAVLNDDLVVLTDPAAGARSARVASLPSNAGVAQRMGGLPTSNSVLCSEASLCLPDVNGDGQLTPADFNAWIIAFNSGLATADQNGDGLVTPADFNAWIANYNAGC